MICNDKTLTSTDRWPKTEIHEDIAALYQNISMEIRKIMQRCISVWSAMIQKNG